MTWRYLLTTIWLALALTTTAQAQSCIDIFISPHENPLRISEQGIFNSHEQREIETILKDTTLRPRDRWTQINNIYLEARVRMFPMEMRRALRKQLNQFRPHFQTDDYEPEMNTNRMSYHEAYIDTPLPYIVQIHEWEHFVRSLARSGGRNPGAGQIKAAFNPVELYKEEGAAMWAEWDVAHLVSDQDAQRLLELVHGTSRKTKYIRFVESMMENRMKDRRAYLQGVRDNGRYSYANVLQKVATKFGVLVVLPSGYLGGMCGFFWWILH